MIPCGDCMRRHHHRSHLQLISKLESKLGKPPPPKHVPEHFFLTASILDDQDDGSERQSVMALLPRLLAYQYVGMTGKVLRPSRR